MGMDWVQTIRGVLTKYAEQPGLQHVVDHSAVHRDFGELAARAPGEVLAEALAAGFRAEPSRTLGQQVALLFHFSAPAQRAELLHLLRGAGDLDQRAAAEVQPEVVERMVDQGAVRDPALVDRISRLYAGHPAIVKNLGIQFLTAAIRSVGARLAGLGAAPL